MAGSGQGCGEEGEDTKGLRKDAHRTELRGDDDGEVGGLIVLVEHGKARVCSFPLR